MDMRWEPAVEPRGRIALLHGMNALAATWWRIGPGLAARGWGVTALDLPGHGDAARLTRPLDLEELADGILDRLVEPVDLLVGHSLGAATALVVAGRRPDLAMALVLEDPPGRDATTDPAVRDAFADNLLADAELAARDRTAVTNREQNDNPTWRPEDIEHSVDGILRADAALLAAGLRQPRAWQIPSMLEPLEIPVLLLVATEGRSALQATQRARTRQLIPSERFVELLGGHCLHRDLPEEWLAHVDAFGTDVIR